MDENNLPSSDLESDVPNEETIKAIKESYELARDNNAKSYDNIEDLRKALDV